MLIPRTSELIKGKNSSVEMSGLKAQKISFFEKESAFGHWQMLTRRKPSLTYPSLAADFSAYCVAANAVTLV